jgi:hypothetical protein
LGVLVKIINYEIDCLRKIWWVSHLFRTSTFSDRLFVMTIVEEQKYWCCCFSIQLSIMSGRNEKYYWQLYRRTDNMVCVPLKFVILWYFLKSFFLQIKTHVRMVEGSNSTVKTKKLGPKSLDQKAWTKKLGPKSLVTNIVECRPAIIVWAVILQYWRVEFEVSWLIKSSFITKD